MTLQELYTCGRLVAFTALAMFVVGPWATNSLQPLTEIPIATATPEATVSVSREDIEKAAVVSYWECIESGRCVRGIASFYDESYTGFAMFSGKPFRHDDPTIAASNCYDIGKRVRVWNVRELETFNERGLSPYQMFIDVTILDRGGGLACAEQWQDNGPTAPDGRILVDLSKAGFELLSPRSRGVTPIAVEVLP